MLSNIVEVFLTLKRNGIEKIKPNIEKIEKNNKNLEKSQREQKKLKFNE